MLNQSSICPIYMYMFTVLNPGCRTSMYPPILGCRTFFKLPDQVLGSISWLIVALLISRKYLTGYRQNESWIMLGVAQQSADEIILCIMYGETWWCFPLELGMMFWWTVHSSLRPNVSKYKNEVIHGAFWLRWNSTNCWWLNTWFTTTAQVHS